MGFLVRRSFLPFSVLIAGFLIPLFFINCQRSNQNFQTYNQDESSTTPPPVYTQVLPEDPFADEKVQIQISPNSSALDPNNVSGLSVGGLQKTAGGEAVLSPGTRLIVIASNDCLRNSQISDPKHSLSNAMYDPAQELSNLDEQSYTWKTTSEIKLDELKTLAAQDPCIRGLANDAIVTSSATTPNDPTLSAQNQMTSIGANETFAFFSDKIHGSVQPVIVAVIDSGIALTHPDLKNQLWTDGSGNYGYNYAYTSTNVNDDYGHGTNVAGIIAAEANNGIGITGVMGHHIKLMTVKVQDKTGAGYVSDIVSGINYARANGANVINISMVGYGYNAALQTALQTAATAKIFIAVAAGNENKMISGNSTSTQAVPAIYGAAISGMMAVGSTAAITNTRSPFSNINPDFVEIAAPGSGGIYFTDMGGGYASGDGTSYAAPQVAAAAALVISFFKQHSVVYTGAMVETALTEGAYRSSALANYFNDGNVLDLRSLKEYLSATYLKVETGGFNDF